MHKIIEPPRINARARKHGMDFAPQPMLSETNYTEGHVRELGGSVPEGTQSVYSKAIEILSNTTIVLYNDSHPTQKGTTLCSLSMDQHGSFDIDIVWLVSQFFIQCVQPSFPEYDWSVWDSGEEPLEDDGSDSSQSVVEMEIVNSYIIEYTFVFANLVEVQRYPNQEDCDIFRCYHCHYDTCEEDDLVQHFLICSQMNGNNGSWTNSDDVERTTQKTKEQGERKRNHKESVTTRYRKGGDNKPKPAKEIALCLLYPNCTRQNCRFLHPVKDDNQVINVVAGISYYNLFGVNCLLKNTGFVLYNPIDGDILVETETDHVELPTFCAMGREFRSRKFVVSKLVYTYMLKLLRTLSCESRNFAVVASFMIEKVGIFNSVVTSDHITYYLYKNKSRAAPGNGVVVAHMMCMAVSTNALMPIPYTDSPQIEYVYGEGFLILQSSGFSFTVENGVVTQYPTFRTDKPLLTEGSANKHAYFQFAAGQPFQVYGRTGKNVCNALSRYFKAQHESRYKRKQQTRLLSGIPEELLHRITEICGAKYLPSGTDPDMYGSAAIRYREVYRNARERKHVEVFPILQDDGKILADVIRENLPSRGIAWLWGKFTQYMVNKFGMFWNFLILVFYTRFYYVYDRVVGLQAYVQLPTTKRLLYQQYVIDSRTIQKILENEGSFQSKFKMEMGKYGKAGRLYATGEHLTLVDKLSADLVKFFFNRDLVVGSLPNGGTFYAVFSDAQDAPSSDRIFARARDLVVGDAMYIFFSDDGYLVINRGNGPEYCETDISSCDATNGFPIFAALTFLANVLEMDGPMLTLLAQCSRPTTIYNPCCRDEYVRLQPQSFFEYSGHNGTTVLNNIASLSIALGIYKKLLEFPVASIVDLAVDGALSYGYDITAEQKTTLNQMTFLKRCCSSSGRSWKVLGTLLRSLGIIDGLPIKDHFGVTYEQFNRSDNHLRTTWLLEQFVKSNINEPGHLVINAVRVRLGMEVVPELITRQDLNERYDTEDYEWSHLEDAITHLSFGDFVSLPILNKIYLVDYGVKIVDNVFPTAHSEWF